MSIRGFEETWRRERDPMVRSVYLTCGDVDLAAEIVDEAFLQVFSRLKGPTSIDNLRGYLWRTAFNGSSRARKRSRRRDELVDLAGRTEQQYMRGPEETLADGELLACLDRLDPQVRDVIVLRFYGDFTVPQIAEHQDLALGTVKSIIHRGIAAMRAELVASAGKDQA